MNKQIKKDTRKTYFVYAIQDDQVMKFIDKLPGYSHSPFCGLRHVGGTSIPLHAYKVYFKSQNKKTAIEEVTMALGHKLWSEHHIPRKV
jgi:hypothetical protein